MDYGVFMMNGFLYPSDKRIFIITGHYGSGKTEFAVSLALLMAKQENRTRKKIALIDLDIANPYFRSRERRDLLEAAGIPVYGSFYKSEITGGTAGTLGGYPHTAGG